MEHFSARGFFWAGVMMQSIESECVSESLTVDPDQPIYNLAAPLNERLRGRALHSLRLIENECRQIGMDITAATANEIQKELKVETALTNFQWLMHQTKALRRLFEKEAKGRVFLYVPAEKSKYFPRNDAPFAFGEIVSDKFPSAQFDIHEAAICLGCSRATACVFHVMRVMEIALTALGGRFGVSLAHTNWAPAIEEIESKIRNMHKDPTWKTLPDCKELQEFYAQAISHFGILKDAWRNYTMHSRGKYTDEEAEQIFESAKAFMQKLAERLQG